MLKIGLTGGIGSGKSTVAQIFEVLGIPVYYADVAAKRLMNENITLKKEILREFGEEAYSGDLLNRPYLASIVFKNPAKLATLNNLVHPFTIADAETWMLQQQSPYSIKEAALIFESNAHLHLDYVIGVQSPLPLRIQRVMERDKLSEAEILARINKQMDETEKMNRCHFIIINDEQELLIPQVVALHEKLLAIR
ncbi:MAG TPA: dephospho-CoA kinase [Ferruginibacter sp.]|nr:dephospho-CoA kinase [Ferruginibacter sp.]